VLGRHRVLWRYDPVFINREHTVRYHADSFGAIANALCGYTEKVTISFIDMYPKTKRNMAGLGITAMDTETKLEIARQLANVARENSIAIEACAENIELFRHGIARAKCIDDNLVSRIAGYPLDIGKDKSQRRECGCVASIDVGAYNTCGHGCLYCYANHSHSAVLENLKNHDKSSSLLIGGDIEKGGYTERIVKSNKLAQPTLF